MNGEVFGMAIARGRAVFMGAVRVAGFPHG